MGGHFRELCGILAVSFLSKQLSNVVLLTNSAGGPLFCAFEVETNDLLSLRSLPTSVAFSAMHMCIDADRISNYAKLLAS